MSFTKKITPEQSKSILLFDGVCNFCNRSVIFVLKRDKRKKIYFASQQSECGKEILQKLGVEILHEEYETVLFIQKGKLYKKSRAVLEILREIGGIWKIFYVFIIIPSPVSDFFYDLIARNRYRFFGKRESCMIPSPEIKSQFLC